MPKPTFYRLPEEKRDKLLEAVKAEFSRVPFAQVSINQIIRAAGIPRGSFYQYFSGKDDVLSYLLTGYKRKLVAAAQDSLERSGGDLIALFAELLDFTVSFVMAEENNAFFRNLFADIQVNTQFYRRLREDADARESVEALAARVDTRRLLLREEGDFRYMIDILFSVCRDATVEVFLNGADMEAAREEYRRKLKLLEQGFMKKQGDAYA